MMRSIVYGIRAGVDGPVKVGFTVKLGARLRQLQCGAHEELRVIWTHPGAVNEERRLHMVLSRFHLRGEFYDVGDMSDERIALVLTRAIESRSMIPIENLPEWLASWPQPG